MSSQINAIITGASSDIGGAIAKHFDRLEGVRLVLVSRHGAPPKVAASHRTLTAIDLTREEDAKLVVAAAEDFDGPFALIHCVGAFWHHKPLVHTSFTEITEMIQSHYVSLAMISRAILPAMVSRKGGRIVAFSCNSVNYAYPDMAPFTSSKAAVETFIRCIANEYSHYNIAANAIALPTVLTKKVSDLKPEANPKHFVSPMDVASVVEQLLRVSPVLLNGNIIKMFRSNPAFFNHGYFERNPRLLAIALDDEHLAIK